MTTTVDFPVEVSVITPAHNAAAVLARAAASLQTQTKTGWEMVIVDDGSSDDTAKIADRLAAADPRLRVLGHPNKQGVAAARNTALAKAQGRYIAFLDADDAWSPEKLELQVTLMHARKAGLSYTGFNRVSEKGTRRIHVPSQITGAQLLLGNCVCCSSAMYDRAVLGSVPMPLLPLRQDYALWLTMLERLPYAVGIDSPLVDLHTTRGSLSSNKWRATRATWAMHRDHFKTGPAQTAYYVLSHSLRRLIRG